MSRASIEDMQPSVLGRPTSEIPGIQGLPWGLRHLVERLGICESKRRLLHMVPGLLPALLGVLPHRDPWEMPLKTTVVAITLVAIAIAFIRERDFARPNETLWHMSVIGYALPVVLLLLLLPGRSEIGLMTLGVLAFGDGSAALGGKLFGRRRLPWNRRKTWAGLGSFLLAGTLAASFNYWVDARPAVPIYVAFLIGGAAALTGAIAESLPIRSHDNFRVGTTAALTGLFMHVLILGW